MSRQLSEARLERIVAAVAALRADLVLFQEVLCKRNVPAHLQAALRDAGFVSFVYSGRPGVRPKQYGNLIAARSELQSRDDTWHVPPPWSQLIARATLRLGQVEIDVVNTHVPNGSGNGWKKIETFECLADYLRKISLKATPELDEQWLQQRIAEDPSILGLGDLVLLQRERTQGTAGRLDLLLSDPDQARRYEVELMLGATDASHVIGRARSRSRGRARRGVPRSRPVHHPLP